MPIAMLLAIWGYAGWHDAKTIVLAPLTQPAYVRVILPQAIDGGPASEYPDLRIADDRNREVPYALDANPATSASQSVALSDVGFVAGKYTQAIADLGQSGALHANVTLETSQPTFFQRVELATSDDRSTWSVVKRDGLIYRVAQNNDAGQSSIDFGPSRARWLRIRVLDGTRAFPLTGASVAAQTAPPRLVPLTASVQRLPDSATNTVEILDFGTPYANLAAAAFETGTPEFSRHVDFSTADTIKGAGSNYESLSSATISRFAAGRPSLTIDLGNQRLRFLKIDIRNGNDPPLAALRVTALGFQHYVIFRAEPGASYRLLWNNNDTTPPTYDLAERLSHESWRAGALATLGASASPAFVPAAAGGTPWLQQAALPIALVVACLVLGAIALLALRSKSSTDS